MAFWDEPKAITLALCQKYANRKKLTKATPQTDKTVSLKYRFTSHQP
nr:hypothetical protein [uncultured Prevotella sp.]